MKKVIAINEHISRQKAAPKAEATQQQNALSYVLDELTNACVQEVSGRTGVQSVELVRHIVREWYGVQFDVPASHLRRAIRQSKRDAEQWVTGTQG